MKTLYENDKYIVEYHPLAGCPFWVIDKNDLPNPLHPVMTYYDEERAIEFANGER